MTHDPSLAYFARKLQHAIPKGLPPFDAEAFLNGTYELPEELQEPPLPGEQSKVRNPKSEIGPTLLARDHRESGEGQGVRTEAAEELQKSPLPVSGEAVGGQGQPQAPLARDHRESGEGPGVRASAPREADQVADQVPDQVSPPEPADTSSHFLKKRKKCRGLKKSGDPCNAYALAAGDLCIYHEADHITNFNEARSRGGQANRRPIMDLENLALDLHHRLDLQAMLETILRAQLSGSLPARRGAQILRNLGIAERNLANIHRDRFANQHKDCETYEQVADPLIAALPRIIENFELEMDAERARAIEDTGAKREEYLKANQRYGHDQPKPTPNYSPSHPKFDPAAFRRKALFQDHPFLQP